MSRRRRTGGSIAVIRTPCRVAPRPAVPALTLRVFFVLAIGAVLGLYVASERTADAFAWTIEPPLTAALLGSAYAGSVVIFGMVARGGPFARSRCAIPTPFVLSVAMLITTLLHLDRFHLDRGGVPGAVAWVWLVVYIIVPPLLAVGAAPAHGAGARLVAAGRGCRAGAHRRRR